jgi:hypothetical protein
VGGLQRLRQLVRLDPLRDERARPELQGLFGHLVRVDSREHRDLHRGHPLLQELDAPEPVHAGHAQVEQHEIRIRLLRDREDLCPGLGNADDLELRPLLERNLDRLHHQGVVVRNNQLEPPHLVPSSSRSTKAHP